jgi:hypothetical protein
MRNRRFLGCFHLGKHSLCFRTHGETAHGRTTFTFFCSSAYHFQESGFFFDEGFFPPPLQCSQSYVSNFHHFCYPISQGRMTLFWFRINRTSGRFRMQPADSSGSEFEDFIGDSFITEDLYHRLLSIWLLGKYSQAYNIETQVWCLDITTTQT